MRHAPTPAITAKMYRHFATMTVALTALLALFANGEKQNAVAAESAAVVQSQAKPKKPAHEDKQELAGDDSGAWGSDESGDFGRPMVSASSGGSWFSNPFGGTGDGRPKSAPGATQPLPDDNDSDGSVKATDAPPSASAIAAAIDASRMRSGAAGRGDD